MKRLFIMISMIVAMAGNAIAQSMSDDQVIAFVVKEQQKGTSQSQIVTKLMQQGVTIDQIRKVRQKVERQKRPRYTRHYRRKHPSSRKQHFHQQPEHFTISHKGRQ